MPRTRIKRTLAKWQDCNIHLVDLVNKKQISIPKTDEIKKLITDTLDWKTKRELNQILNTSETKEIWKELERNNFLDYENKKLQENTRFDRQLLFLSNYVNTTRDLLHLQTKIEKARIVIIGLGGLGSTIAKSLVACGIQNLLLIDFDKIEMHNLNRCLLFNEQDVGKPKTTATKEKLKNFHSRVRIKTANKPFQKAKKEITTFKPDYILNCADRPSIEITTNELVPIARRAKCPLMVAGGYFCQYGFVGPILDPPRKVKVQKPVEIFNEVSGGSIAPITNAVANIAGHEILVSILKQGKPQSLNKRLLIDFSTLTVKKKKIN